MKRKTWELIFLFIYYLLVFGLILIFKLNYLWGVLLYLVIPSFYITLRNKKIFKKSFLSSLLLSLPAVFVIDYIAHVSGSWIESSNLGIRIMNSYPIESFFWGISYVYFIISFYEYFFDKDKDKKTFSFNTKYLVSIVSFVCFLFGLIFFINKDLLVIKYFYTFLILILFITPGALILKYKPKLLNKSLKQGAYFFLITIIYELSAIYAGHWHFKGEYYIGFVEIFNLRFPFEELLWLIFAVPAVVLWYEFFLDDQK